MKSSTAKRLSADGLEKLRQAAEQSDTSALVVLEDGDVVLEYGNTTELIELMSVSKSVVSLVIGQLVDAGLVRLDQSMADFIPSWRDTPKARITVQHILGHTSGLADKKTTEDIYASPDFVKFAEEAEVVAEPGAKLFYSNRAVNLLARVAQVATGESLDEYARKHLFEPLGINHLWSKDPAGNPQVMAGIRLSARDLAKLGQLVLDPDVCKPNILSRAWLERSTRTYDGPLHTGLLWWLQPETMKLGFSAQLFRNWRELGVPEDFIQKFVPLQDQYFEPEAFFQAVSTALTGSTAKPTEQDLKPWYEMTWMAGRPDGEMELGPVGVIRADGYGGQFLLAYPNKGVVVARLRKLDNVDPQEKQSFLKSIDDALWPKK